MSVLHDTAIAKDIIATLKTQQTSAAFRRDPCELVFGRNPYIDFDGFTGTQIRATPGQMTHRRVARKRWRRETTVELRFFGKADDAGDKDEFESWCQFVSEIIAMLQDRTFAGRPVVTITSPERFDADLLQTADLFSTIYFFGFSHT